MQCTLRIFDFTSLYRSIFVVYTMSNDNNSHQIQPSMPTMRPLDRLRFFASHFSAVIITISFFPFLSVFYYLLCRLYVLGLQAAHDLSSLGHHVSVEDISA